MKKFTIVVTVLIAITIKTNAQIPNSGFEDWTTVGNCMKPDGWYTTNDFSDTTGTYFGVTRSTDNYPPTVGSYSIRIQNNPLLMPDFSGIGFAFPGNDMSAADNPAFSIVGHPTSLNGYYKFLPENGDTMRIYIQLYNNGVSVFSVKLEDSITVPDWQPFTISFPVYTNADSARIVLFAMDSDHGSLVPSGNSVLYVDNMSFDSLITTSVSEFDRVKTSFRFYPNPASDIVTLNIDNVNNADLTLNIYNVIGKLVRYETLRQNQRQINIGYLSNGIYMVEIKSKEWSENQKLIIQR
jgi:hypothetical protein